MIIIRSLKWWKRVMFHLLDLSLVNANILYNSVALKPLPHLEFCLSIAASLLEGHTPRIDRRLSAPACELPLRLTERAFPEKIPRNTPYRGCPQCEVCRARGRRSQMRYRCKVCKTPLHVNNCLEIYHTKLHYEQQ